MREKQGRGADTQQHGGAVTGVKPQQGQRTDLKTVEKKEPEWESGGKLRLLLLSPPPTHTHRGR